MTNKLVILFYRREKCGQTASTTVAYLKVLKPLLEQAMTIFHYQDPTFPKVNGVSDRKEFDLIRYTVDRLKLIFRGAGKKSNQETFNNKVMQIDSLPSFTLIWKMVQTMRAELDDNLSDLEALFNSTTAKVDVSSTVVEKKRTNTVVMRFKLLQCYIIW